MSSEPTHPCKIAVGDRVDYAGRGELVGTVLHVEAYVEEEEDEDGEPIEEFQWWDVKVIWDGREEPDWYTEEQVELYDDAKSHVPEDWS